MNSFIKVIHEPVVFLLAIQALLAKSKLQTAQQGIATSSFTIVHSTLLGTTKNMFINGNA